MKNEMKKWKLVFFIMAFLVLFDFLSFPFKSNINIYDFIGLIFLGLSLIPFYGFAYTIAIGNQPIAIIIFSLNAFGTLVACVFGLSFFFNNLSLLNFLFAVLGLSLSYIFIFPQYMYAFKSNHLWKKTHSY
jgi:hypothetical protein